VVGDLHDGSGGWTAVGRFGAGECGLGDDGLVFGYHLCCYGCSGVQVHELKDSRVAIVVAIEPRLSERDVEWHGHMQATSELSNSVRHGFGKKTGRTSIDWQLSKRGSSLHSIFLATQDH
jgi:hypothetical protein